MSEDCVQLWDAQQCTAMRCAIVYTYEMCNSVQLWNVQFNSVQLRFTTVYNYEICNLTVYNYEMCNSVQLWDVQQCTIIMLSVIICNYAIHNNLCAIMKRGLVSNYTICNCVYNHCVMDNCIQLYNCILC